MPFVLVKLSFFHALVWLLAGPAYSLSPKPFILQETLDAASPSDNLAVFFDEHEKLTFSQIKEDLSRFSFKGIGQHRFKPGSGRIWAYVDIWNKEKVAKKVYLVNRVYLADTAVFYAAENGVYKAYERHFDKRYFGNEQPFRLPYLALNIPPGKHRIFMSQTSFAFNRLNIAFYDQNSFYKSERLIELFITLFIGAIFCLILIKIIEYIGSRDISIIFYAGSALSLSLGAFFLSGLWRYLSLAPQINSAWILGLLVTFTLLIVFCPIEFAIHYLNLHKDHKRMVRVLRFVWIAMILTILFLLYQNLAFGLSIAMAFCLMGYLTSCILSIWKAKTSIPARYLACGWIITMLSIVISNLVSFEVLPNIVFLRTAIIWCTLIEFIIFFFGLSRISSDLAQNRQDEIENLNFQLENRVATLKKLAGGLAHEINNPLAILSGNLDIVLTLAEKGTNNEKIIPRVTTSIKTIYRISSITGDLLAFSQDKKPDEFSVISIDKVLKQLIIALRRDLVARNIKFTFDGGKQEKLIILANPLSLAEAFIKIIDNSIDALVGCSQPELAICVVEVDEKWMEITITDNGIGIDEAIRERIFEPFFTTKAAKKMPGLGLSSALSIIEMHGGTLVLDAEKEKTCFRIRLPLHS